MAKCKYCGNSMTDEAYVMNNGMCNLCLRSSQGEDDPIIARQETPVMSMQDKLDNAWARRMSELEEKEKFHPEEFEGRSIKEFKFPEFIVSKVVFCADSLNGEALLLTTHKPFETFDIVMMVIYGLFISPFVAAGLFLIGMLLYSCLGGYVDGLTGNLSSTIFLFIFACVWNGFVWGGIVWGTLIKRAYIYDWVLLKDKGIECYSGHQFKSEKANRYDLRNIDIHLDRQNAKRGYSYWLKVSNAAGENKTFEMFVDKEREGKYWESFLKWYISNYCSGHGAGKRA